MGSGKCSRKGWAWKSVKPQLLEFGDNDPIGTIKCEIYAQEDSPFCESERLNASEIFGFVSYEPCILRFHITGLANKPQDIKAFTSLKASIAASDFESADKAVLSVKKSQTQIATFRCGSK